MAVSRRGIQLLTATFAVLVVWHNFSAISSRRADTTATDARGAASNQLDRFGPSISRQTAAGSRSAVEFATPHVSSRSAVEFATAPVGLASSTTSSDAEVVSAEVVSAVRARLAAVPVSKANGRLSGQCRLTVDPERRKLLRYVAGGLGGRQVG